MEGLERQFDILCEALQPLGLGHSRGHHRPPVLPDEVVSELQMALARATVVARWVTSVQRGQSLRRSLSGGCAEAPLHGGPLDNRQTLGSVALRFHVSVADIRRWNPQLASTLRQEDVLPPDTYLKIRPAPSSIAVAQLAAASAPRTDSAASSTLHSGASVSAFASIKTPRIDAECAGNVTVLPRHSTESRSQGALSHKPDSTGICSRGMGSGGFPSSSDGVMSQTRYSGWTEDAGRGTSYSPELSEPSMPSSCGNIAPPACSPVPVLMSIPINPYYSPEGNTSIDLKERVMNVSPSPEGGPRSSSSTAHRGLHARKASPPPTPGPSKTSPPSFGDVPAFLKNTSVSTREATLSDEGFDLRNASGNGSRPVKGAQENSARGHTHPSSHNSGDETPTTLVGIRKGQRSAKGTMVAPAATNAYSHEGIQSLLSNNLAERMLQKRHTTGPAAGATPLRRDGAMGGLRALSLPSGAREVSVSLSAPSPRSSLGTEGRDNSAHSCTLREGDAEGEGLESTVETRSQPLSPLERLSNVFVLSPSLAAPSDTSSGSPTAKGARVASIVTPMKGSVVSADTESPSCSRTPIASRDHRDHAHATGAALLSTGYVRRNWRSISSSVSSRGSRSGTGAAVDGSTQLYMDDFAGDEDERSISSMRPPSMLGSHACSPPPNLSRGQQRNRTGADAPSVPRHAIQLPVQLRQSPLTKTDADSMGLVPPFYAHPFPPSLPVPSQVHDTSSEAELEGTGGDYDTLEGIAATHSLTVPIILKWNPYLTEYAPSEPLPPGLPIVLPMSDEEGEEEDREEPYSVTRKMALEPPPLPPPKPKFLSHDASTSPPPRALDNSPLAHPPLKEEL